MPTVTGTTKDAVAFLVAYEKRTRTRPFSLSPTDIAKEIGSTAQVVGMAMKPIVQELKLLDHDVVYQKINNKRKLTFRAA